MFSSPRLHRVALVLILVVPPVATASCNTGYVLDQGVDFIGLMNDRVPIESAVEDPDVPASHREKLKIVLRARSFADEDLELEVSDRYTTYVHVDREAVSWNITATPWNDTAPLTWSFPLVGTFPYISFFEKQDAAEYRDELKAEGKDVHMRPVSAFSTIGWFSDPVYSTMLDQSEPVLVETVIHELLHGSVFFKNNVQLSEAAAAEIGRLATIAYLKKRYGPSDDLVSRTRAYYRDLDRVNQFFLDLRERLRTLYRSDLSERRMRREKKRAFRRARRSFSDMTGRLGTKGWESLLDENWNNAYVSANAVYSSHTDLIRRLWKRAFEKDLRRSIAFLKSIVDADDPVRRIRAKIEEASRGSPGKRARR